MAWHVCAGKPMGTCKGHKRGVWCVKFSPVDKVAALALPHVLHEALWGRTSDDASLN